MALASPPDLAKAEHPIQPLARTYPRGHMIEPHVHDWGQLLYAESGVMWVDTPTAALLVPPHRAVWIPPHIHHGVRVVSDLEMCNIYLREELAERIGSALTVVEVSPLLRELIRRRVSLETTFKGLLTLYKMSNSEKREEAEALVKNAFSEIMTELDATFEVWAHCSLMVGDLGESIEFSF